MALVCSALVPRQRVLWRRVHADPVLAHVAQLVGRVCVLLLLSKLAQHRSTLGSVAFGNLLHCCKVLLCFFVPCAAAVWQRAFQGLCQRVNEWRPRLQQVAVIHNLVFFFFDLFFCGFSGASGAFAAAAVGVFVTMAFVPLLTLLL